MEGGQGGEGGVGGGSPRYVCCGFIHALSLFRVLRFFSDVLRFGKNSQIDILIRSCSCGVFIIFAHMMWCGFCGPSGSRWCRDFLVLFFSRLCFLSGARKSKADFAFLAVPSFVPFLFRASQWFVDAGVLSGDKRTEPKPSARDRVCAAHMLADPIAFDFVSVGVFTLVGSA